VALTPEQVKDYELPPQPGKETDSRATAFVRRHGQLLQVELDALPPDVLHSLYQEAIAPYWNTSAYLASLEKEEEDDYARLAGEVETTNRDVSSSLAIVHVPIDDLKADPANPRRISMPNWKPSPGASGEFGLIDPIIARKEDRTVIGGHQRLLSPAGWASSRCLSPSWISPRRRPSF